MRKVILYVCTVCLLGIPTIAVAMNASNFVYAANNDVGLDEACNTSEAKNSTYCQNRVNNADPDENPVQDLIVKITNIVAWMGGIIAVIFIIYAGFRYVISSGNPEKTSAALKTIIYSLAGLITIIAARTLIVLVIDRL